MKFSEGDLVRIKWVDSVMPTGPQRWMDPEDIDPDTSGCLTVGFVSRKTRDQVTVVQTMDMSTGFVNGAISIPRCAITAVEHLDIQ